MKATDEGKKHMLEILKRLHIQDSEQAQDLASGPGSSDEEGSGEPLSKETLERLRRKVRNPPRTGAWATDSVLSLRQCHWP